MFDGMQEIRINVRTTAQIKRDLEITAELRGLTVSALVNSLVVKAIREEKLAEPSAFDGKRPIREIGGHTLAPTAESKILTQHRQPQKTKRRSQK